MTASTLVALPIPSRACPGRGHLWGAVVNGFSSPPLLVVIMLIANNRAVMGTASTAARRTCWAD